MDRPVFAPPAETEQRLGRWPLRDDVFAPSGEDRPYPAQEALDLAWTDREPRLDTPESWSEDTDHETEGPPPPYAGMPLGVDLSDYQATTQRGRKVAQPVATFQRLVRLGKVFAIVKSSQWQAEAAFRGHYDNARAAGLIRGSYHFFTPRPVAEQVRLVLGLVPRVGPGELAPALDVEDGSKKLWDTYKYTYDGGGTPAGSKRLLDALQEWLDAVEAALGRTPIVYTGVIWRDGLKSTRMSQYPLWTIPNRFPMGGWRRVDIFQYGEEGQPKNHPSRKPYHEPGVDMPGVDYDAYHGTIYGLRGLADLGRVGVGLSPLGTLVAHAEPDRHVHLVRESPPRTWTDTDLMQGALPGLGGDPELQTAGTLTRIWFRSDGRVVEATQANPTGAWEVEDLSSVAGVNAVHDPRVAVAGDRRFVVFSGEDDDWHLLTRADAAPWTVTHLLSTARRSGGTTVPQSSGQPVVYLSAAASPCVVGRAGPMGHLVELALGPSGWAATDLTARATGPQGIPPAATYSPAVYHVGSEAFVVYRAIRGDLWRINRTTGQATNLTGAVPGSMVAVGHPTCFVLAGQVHVVYRGVDRGLHELTERNGAWSGAVLPCQGPAASDPTCTADATTGVVAFRADDGIVRLLRFDGSTWTCTETVRPANVAPPTPVPAPDPARPAGSSVFASLGAAAGRFRELVAAGDVRSAAQLAYEHHQRNVNQVTDLVFFARHPELGERRLRPDETALAQEWRTIRDGVVAPVVAALAQPGEAAGPAGEALEVAEATAPGAAWLRAMSTAEVESGAATEGEHSEGGLGAIVRDVGRTVTDVVTGAGDVLARVSAQAFDDFLQRVDELERLAIADGYAFTQRVTAFRKVFYDSAGSRSSYPGAPSGGVWNVLIPGAAATTMPPSWGTATAAAKVRELQARKVLLVNGVSVDMGHVLTGLDARGHPTTVSLSLLGFPLVHMRSNLEATTFTGDLGSVVGQYIRSSKRSFRDTAMELQPRLLDDTYKESADGDMAGNADAHLIALDPSRTLVENLRDYYRAASGGWRRRWQAFAMTIGLGSFTPASAVMGAYWQSVLIGTFSGSTERWRADMQGEVMNAALAYAAAKGHRGDVVNVLSDPGPGIVRTTFWEMYWNVSGWVLDEFLRKLKRAVVAETSP